MVFLIFAVKSTFFPKNAKKKIGNDQKLGQKFDQNCEKKITLLPVALPCQGRDSSTLKSSICLLIFLILTHFNFFSLFASARIILFLQDFLTLLRGSFMILVYIYVRNPHLRNFAWDTMMGKRKLVNVQTPNEMQLHPIV